MKILVVAATRFEIAGLYTHFGLPELDFVQTAEFDILVTGVGMTATAFALGRYIYNGYGLVLNLGIAGCFDRSVATGAVLNITEDELAELGAEDHERFIGIESLGFGKSKFRNGPFREELTEKDLSGESFARNSTALNALASVKGITVNTVHGNAGSIAAIVERLRPVTESMEGAAVFYACAQANVPGLQVRAVSNYVEPRNRDNWKTSLAIESLHNWAVRFLTNT